MLQRQKWRNRREIRVQVVPREDLGEAVLMEERIVLYITTLRETKNEGQ
jgi:hypothetical protein